MASRKRGSKRASAQAAGAYFGRLCEALCVVPSGGGWPDAFGSALGAWVARRGGLKIKTLSLFTGAGGLDIGFHDAGFEITDLVEIDERFASTLKANTGDSGRFGECRVHPIDIRKFHPPPGARYEFIIGGPPCQTFSAAGRRASGVRATKEKRGQLFLEYVRLLKEIQPHGFLFENVYGLTGAQKGKPWKKIKEAFESAGYTVFHRILDSADYGVPQHRERLFVVGLRRGQFLFPRPSHGPDSEGQRPLFAAREALARASRRGPLPGRIGGRYKGLLEQIPPGLNYSFFTKRMGHPRPIFAWRSKFSDFLYKADPETPTRTIKAQGGLYTGPFHWDSRPFSLGELKRLQTFPDRYEISGGKMAAVHQIGNSVPPQIARILALAVREQVFSPSAARNGG
jgi:DNA (cytosine-5)-methyltransferase 1